MNEPFHLSVSYRGAESAFKARFERLGDTHRIAVLVGETTIIFEPDEKGSYLPLAAESLETGLIRVIAEKLAALRGSSV